jgi:hypothetical protein
MIGPYFTMGKCIRISYPNKDDKSNAPTLAVREKTLSYKSRGAKTEQKFAAFISSNKQNRYERKNNT